MANLHVGNQLRRLCNFRIRCENEKRLKNYIPSFTTTSFVLASFIAASFVMISLVMTSFVTASFINS